MKKSFLIAICAMAALLGCKPGSTNPSEAGLPSGDSTAVGTTLAKAGDEAVFDSLKTDTVSSKRWKTSSSWASQPTILWQEATVWSRPFVSSSTTAWGAPTMVRWPTGRR